MTQKELRDKARSVIAKALDQATLFPPNGMKDGTPIVHPIVNVAIDVLRLPPSFNE